MDVLLDGGCVGNAGVFCFFASDILACAARKNPWTRAITPTPPDDTGLLGLDCEAVVVLEERLEVEAVECEGATAEVEGTSGPERKSMYTFLSPRCVSRGVRRNK